MGPAADFRRFIKLLGGGAGAGAGGAGGGDSGAHATPAKKPLPLGGTPPAHTLAVAASSARVAPSSSARTSWEAHTEASSEGGGGGGGGACRGAGAAAGAPESSAPASGLKPTFAGIDAVAGAPVAPPSGAALSVAGPSEERLSPPAVGGGAGGGGTGGRGAGRLR
jgi:hypothetical protein